MKKIKVFLVLLAVLAVAAFSSCQQVKESAKLETPAPAVITAMKPGVYKQAAKGMYDGLVVEVTLSEKKIEKVAVVEHKETPGIAAGAIETLPGKIVAAQSLSVDLVSGATMTSKGILAAVAQAIATAGGKAEEFKKPGADSSAVAAARTNSGASEAVDRAALPKKWDMEYDVVVVGGGFAGLAAAHSAATNGAKTVLVEKMPFVGGNSQISGGVYAAYTSKIAADFQKKLNLVPDTAEAHIADTMKGGDYMSDIKLVRNMVYGAPFYLNMLLDNGLKVRESLTRPGGHFGYRTYSTMSGQGSDIVEVQKKMCKEAGVQTLVNSKMVKIYREGELKGKVVGIGVETKSGYKTIMAKKAVVLATGGFGANVDMRSKHVPSLTSDIPTTNHVGATGEGITIAQEVGANTMQMSYIQLYPFADPNNGVLDATAVIPFSGPSAGIVYVNEYGKRYVNEGERRDVCAKAAQESGGFPTFSIFGEEIYRKGGFITEGQMKAGVQADRIFVANTLEQLAAEINKRTYKGEKVDMKGADLVATIAKHNDYVKNLKDLDFGKRIDKGVMMTIEKGPYYAIPQWPSVHHTMGGITITDKTEVQDIYGKVIPGFFAAGEVTGGVHGTNRLGSNAVSDCVANGYIAGQMAARGTLPDFIKGKN